MGTAIKHVAAITIGTAITIGLTACGGQGVGPQGGGSSTAAQTQADTSAAPSDAAQSAAAINTSAASPAVVPDPCTLISKAALEAALGMSVGAGIPGQMQHGKSCEFQNSINERIIVMIENTWPTVEDFDTTMQLAKESGLGFGEAARSMFSDVGVTPQETLWVYSKGLSYAFVISVAGKTEPDLLGRLRTLAGTVTY